MDFEEAWKAYTMLEAVGWSSPPYLGGWLDMPDLLMTNVFRIAALTSQIRKRLPPEG